MAPKMKSLSSYSTAMDYARLLEMKEIEAHELQEQTKKHKTEGTYGG